MPRMREDSTLVGDVIFFAFFVYFAWILGGHIGHQWYSAWLSYRDELSGPGSLAGDFTAIINLLIRMGISAYGAWSVGKKVFDWRLGNPRALA